MKAKQVVNYHLSLTDGEDLAAVPDFPPLSFKPVVFASEELKLFSMKILMFALHNTKLKPEACL